MLVMPRFSARGPGWRLLRSILEKHFQGRPTHTVSTEHPPRCGGQGKVKNARGAARCCPLFTRGIPTLLGPRLLRSCTLQREGAGCYGLRGRRETCPSPADAELRSGAGVGSQGPEGGPSPLSTPGGIFIGCSANRQISKRPFGTLSPTPCLGFGWVLILCASAKPLRQMPFAF